MSLLNITFYSKSIPSHGRPTGRPTGRACLHRCLIKLKTQSTLGWTSIWDCLKVKPPDSFTDSHGPRLSHGLITSKTKHMIEVLGVVQFGENTHNTRANVHSQQISKMHRASRSERSEWSGSVVFRWHVGSFIGEKATATVAWLGAGSPITFTDGM